MSLRDLALGGGGLRRRASMDSSGSPQPSSASRREDPPRWPRRAARRDPLLCDEGRVYVPLRCARSPGVAGAGSVGPLPHLRVHRRRLPPVHRTNGRALLLGGRGPLQRVRRPWRRAVSRSPYAAEPGPRRCSRGTLYTPSVSGCPCCRELAARTRKVKMLPARRKCRLCREAIIDLRHHNQHYHPQCRDDEAKKLAAANRRQRRKREMTPALCRVGSCRRPATTGVKCARHREQRSQQDLAARARRKWLGVCRDCRKLARPGGVYCVECVEKVRASAARWRDRKRPERYWLAWSRPRSWICRHCCGPVAYDGVGRPASLCTACRDRRTSRYEALRQSDARR